jgi:hypothetical protein
MTEAQPNASFCGEFSLSLDVNINFHDVYRATCPVLLQQANDLYQYSIQACSVSLRAVVVRVRISTGRY